MRRILLKAADACPSPNGDKNRHNLIFDNAEINDAGKRLKGSPYVRTAPAQNNLLQTEREQLLHAAAASVESADAAAHRPLLKLHNLP